MRKCLPACQSLAMLSRMQNVLVNVFQFYLQWKLLPQVVEHFGVLVIFRIEGNRTSYSVEIVTKSSGSREFKQ